MFFYNEDSNHSCLTQLRARILVGLKRWASRHEYTSAPLIANMPIEISSHRLFDTAYQTMTS